MKSKWECQGWADFLPLLVSSNCYSPERRQDGVSFWRPVFSFSGGRSGLGEHGGLVNHCADVHRLGSFLSRSRDCQERVPSLWLLLPARRWRPCCRRINFSSPSLAPLAFSSSVNGGISSWSWHRVTTAVSSKALMRLGSSKALLMTAAGDVWCFWEAHGSCISL